MSVSEPAEIDDDAAPGPCCGGTEPWRADFPVDWPQDHYVARRDFTKFLVLTSLAFVVGQIWIGVQNALRRFRGRPPIRRVAALRDIAVGSAFVFQYPRQEDPCILMRPAADLLLACSQACTHLSCPVVPDLQEGIIRCPCHHGEFDLKTGQPLAGPPRRPLSQVQLEVRQGVVYATGIRRRTQ